MTDTTVDGLLATFDDDERAAAYTLPVVEMFGPTFQGEGPSAGQLAHFIRLGGCNLTCHGCDTPYTWDAKRYDLRQQMAPQTAAQILGEVPDCPLVVITGGEPLLYRRRRAMHALITKLANRGSRVEVETNGTLPPDQLLALDVPGERLRFNVSPKLTGPMSEDPGHQRIRPVVLEQFGRLAQWRRAVFKFVCKTEADVQAAVRLADQCGAPRDRVWVMPEGISVAAILAHAQAIADPALAAGINLTLRQHVLLWPDVSRGR